MIINVRRDNLARQSMTEEDVGRYCRHSQSTLDLRRVFACLSTSTGPAVRVREKMKAICATSPKGICG